MDEGRDEPSASTCTQPLGAQTRIAVGLLERVLERIDAVVHQQPAKARLGSGTVDPFVHGVIGEARPAAPEQAQHPVIAPVAMTDRAAAER